MTRFCFFLMVTLMHAAYLRGAATEYYAVHVVDEATGRGVPLMTLTTVNHMAFVTDSGGWIAFNEPGLMDGGEVFFHVSGPGYAMEKDGFGYAGVRLKPKAGTMAEVKVRRENIAERLYRITGQGIYRDSLLLGKEVPAVETGWVMGQDSVQAVPYQGRLFWLWGDTNRPSYPLGNFRSTCAWSDLPGKGGMNPGDGVILKYLLMGKNHGVREMVSADGPGMVWVFGLMAVPDAGGTEHLLGHYGRFKDLKTRVDHGIVEYRSQASASFEIQRQLSADDTWRHPEGNAVRVADKEGDYFYFCDAFAATRVKADYDSVLEPRCYEALAWSPQQKGYVWQKDKPPVTQAEEAALAEVMPAGKARFQLRDAATGRAVLVHRSCAAWNAYRQCWIMIALQTMGGPSMLGEIWYAEAPAITGPWVKAVKIASHPRYSFYNPRLHPYFDQEGGRLIYFEGTYSETFSGNPAPTPRYDYNQLMYRLDLADERLGVVRGR